jgi:hypothetical protein
MSTREYADHTFRSGSSPRLSSFVSHNAVVLDRMRALAGRQSVTESVPARLPPLVSQFAIFVAGKIGRSDISTTLDRTTIDTYS